MKILHLPMEIAGQVSLTAQAQRRAGHDAKSMSVPHAFGFPVDLPIRRHTRTLTKALAHVEAFAKIVGRYDVYHYHFGRPLFPGYQDVRILESLGKRLFVEFWGSDARLPAMESKRNPYYVNAYQESDTDNKVRMAIWADLTGGVAIYSDHTLNEVLAPYFNKVHVVGQRVDMAGLEPAYPNPEAKTVKIVHAPTLQSFKGTEQIETALDSLNKRNLPFSYERIEGLNHVEALARYKSADLVIDQVLAGSHGVLAAEVMAMGKPVVGFILPEFESGYPAGFPVINANPETLEDTLAQWIADPARLHEQGKASRRYAERIHDADRIGRTLVGVYNGQGPAKGIIDWRGGNP